MAVLRIRDDYHLLVHMLVLYHSEKTWPALFNTVRDARLRRSGIRADAYVRKQPGPMPRLRQAAAEALPRFGGGK